MQAAEQASPLPHFWGSSPEEEFFAAAGVRNTKSFIDTPYGRLFTQSWLPAGTEVNAEASPRALVFFTHGYASDTSWLFQSICISFAQWGYAAYSADLLGHGQSDGLPGYIEDVETTASAALFFYKSIRDRPEHAHLKKFLFGESMGGGLTFLMLLQDPHGWDGAIFSAPFFMVPKPAQPSRLRLFGYSLLLGYAETWPVMPQNNVKGNVFHDPDKAKVIRMNPRRFKLPARVGTMRQLMRLCDIFNQRCAEISTAFLVLHGTDDTCTSHEGSRMLYNKAKSSDKTMNLYEGFYHSLLQAELKENSERVYQDIQAWIDARTTAAQ